MALNIKNRAGPEPRPIIAIKAVEKGVNQTPFFFGLRGHQPVHAESVKVRTMTEQAFYPDRQELDAYGKGGFRFAEFSHKGSVLILPSGIYGWQYSKVQDVDASAFELVFKEDTKPEFLLFGTGEEQSFPSLSLQKAFIDAKIGLEVMDTGAAARTFNILFAEGRNIAAALIAVD